MSLGILDFIDAEGSDGVQGAMLQPPVDDALDASRTLSQVVWKDSAVSFQDSLHAQRASTRLYAWVS